jgi:hypothetical protein
MIPAHVTTLRLVSDSTRSGQDNRRLGALITALHVDGAPMALNDPRLGLGFHEVEQHGAQCVRWTDGAATITLGRSEQPRALTLRIAAVNNTIAA